MAEKKYYWLKLKKDFFKRHDIRIIESMPNGKDYILFYLKLLVESLSHNGNLRFSDTIPYSENMLATITNTNIDIVKSAMEVFEKLNMIEVLDDQTIFMAEVDEMIGCETKWAEKKRLYRQNQEALEDKSETIEDNVRQEKEKELEIDIDIKESMQDDKPSSHTQKQKKHKIGEYNHVLLNDEELDKLKKDYGTELTDKAIQFLDEYIEMKGYKAKSHYLCIKKWVVDAVKEKQSKNKQEPVKPKQNTFNSFPQREYSKADMSSFEAKIIARQRGEANV